MKKKEECEFSESKIISSIQKKVFGESKEKLPKSLEKTPFLIPKVSKAKDLSLKQHIHTIPENSSQKIEYYYDSPTDITNNITSGDYYGPCMEYDSEYEYHYLGPEYYNKYKQYESPLAPSDQLPQHSQHYSQHGQYYYVDDGQQNSGGSGDYGNQYYDYTHLKNVQQYNYPQGTYINDNIGTTQGLNRNLGNDYQYYNQNEYCQYNNSKINEINETQNVHDKIGNQHQQNRIGDLGYGI